MFSRAKSPFRCWRIGRHTGSYQRPSGTRPAWPFTVESRGARWGWSYAGHGLRRWRGRNSHLQIFRLFCYYHCKHRCRSSVNFEEQDIFARKYLYAKLMKCQNFTWYLPENALSLHDIAWKINKMPEFYVIFASKIFFSGISMGIKCRPRPLPVFYAYNC